MTTTYTVNKNLAKPENGDDVDTWDVPVNGNSDIVDACLGIVSQITITGSNTYTLSDVEYQATTIYVAGVLNSGNVVVKLPAGVSGQFTFINATTQTDATSTFQIGWTSGGNIISISQNTTQILTGDGAAPYWFRSAPPFSGVSTAITSISLTGLSTYTFTAVDTNTQVIKFTGTLSNLTVTVKMPTTISGQWTIVNATTAAGASSLLQLQWSAGGNTYNVNQSSTQLLYADSNGPTWASAATVAREGITYINITSQTSINITDAQTRNRTFYIYGTSTAGVNTIYMPRTAYGTYTFLNNWTSGGGALILAPASPGGGAIYLTNAQNNMVVLSETTGGAQGWEYAADPTTSKA